MTSDVWRYKMSTTIKQPGCWVCQGTARILQIAWYGGLYLANKTQLAVIVHLCDCFLHLVNYPKLFLQKNKKLRKFSNHTKISACLDLLPVVVCPVYAGGLTLLLWHRSSNESPVNVILGVWLMRQHTRHVDWGGRTILTLPANLNHHHNSQ